MRKIKFRAWDIYENKMLFCTDIFSISPDGSFLQYADQGYLCNNANASKEHKEYLLSRSIEPIDEFVLMQYVGLKDKNGVEIYENDILKQLDDMPYRFKEKGLVRYESDYGGYIVEGEYSKNQHHEKLTCDVAFDCEVIGNIYQHPHLLTQNK